MEYTVEFPDRVSNSAFIYYIENNKLFGCDIVISTDRDVELYEEQSNMPIRFWDLKFGIVKSFFETEPVKDLENKIKIIEQKQKLRGWNCIQINGKNELDLAINHHFSDYKRSVKNRLVLVGREESILKGEEFA